MTTRILQYMGCSDYLSCEFQYGAGSILKPTHENIFTIPEKYLGGMLEKNNWLPHEFTFIRKDGTQEWRRYSSPEEIRSQMQWCVLTTPILYFFTTVKRIAEGVVLFAQIFFDTFNTVYAAKHTDNLSRTYTQELASCYREKQKQFRDLWDAIKEDFHCAVVMEAAAIRAVYNGGQTAMRMQFLFGDTEKKWNHKKDIKQIPSYNACLFKVKAVNIFKSWEWLYMVHKCKPDTSGSISKTIKSDLSKQLEKLKKECEKLQEKANENANKIKKVKELIQDREGIIERKDSDILDWWTIHMNLKETHPVTKRDIKLLQAILDEDEAYSKMTTVELTQSMMLQIKLVWKHSCQRYKASSLHGFVLYPLAYPFTGEKQERIEISKQTISNSIKNLEIAVDKRDKEATKKVQTLVK